MPRTKKAAGTAVDRRNGRRSEVAPSALAKFALPRRSSGEPWLLETKRAWDALWCDPVATALTPVDRPVLLRWADSLDRAARSLAEADADPIAKGSMGQAVESPHYGIADKALRTARECEKQLGVGALNRAALGIAVVAARESLESLNARLAQASAVVSDDDDPR